MPGAFDAAAGRYDLMVALNPGYHRHLRSAADTLAADMAEWGAERGGRPLRLVDLGCGSGASTRAILSQLGEAVSAPDGIDLVGVDASAGMLTQARQKRWRRGVRFVTGRAEELSSSRDGWGLAAPVDGIFAAYLFRNVTARDEVLAAAYDLLAPGGTLVVQEYSVAGRPRHQFVWSLVCWLAVIPLAWLTSLHIRLYRYLWRSVMDFDSTEIFMARMQRVGFVDVRVRTVPGWQRGILHTFAARKPR
ncbi:MAG: class I SAM-dependent methyltransferase [Propionibacteriaceae bacterium]